ncbi:MAG: P-loop NTPase [Verrucomicrobiales bacterium]|nr:P-loop NTPase [Verrucomicrobiales bacterium]
MHASHANDMNSDAKPLAGQRIGVFGRGGSGKSTCVVMLARALARAGYAVCVVDADSTNEGLAQALGAAVEAPTTLASRTEGHPNARP